MSPRSLIRRPLEESKQDAVGALGVAAKMAGKIRKGREAEVEKDFQGGEKNESSTQENTEVQEKEGHR